MLYLMKQTIHFLITKSDQYYIAECKEVAIVTNGKTWDELVANIREATELHFEVANEHSAGKTQQPSISVNFELPQPA